MILRALLRQGILWLIATFLFLALLFMPRNAVYSNGRGGMFISAKYHYSVEEHTQQFKDFFTYIKENKGLGEIIDGHSLTKNIGRTFFKSMKIAIPALLIGFFGGIAKGIFDYRFRNRKARILGEGMTKLFLAIPDLFLIIMVQILIMTAIQYGLLPYMSVYGSDTVSSLVLGIIYLSIYPLFYIANITYSSIREEQGRDYIITAFSKGTSSLKVLYTHVLKNCLVKILSHTNTITLYTLSNLFIVEYLTNYRGAALFFWEAVRSQNIFFVGQKFTINPYPAAGYVILFTSVIFLSNTVSQIARGMVSPMERV